MPLKFEKSALEALIPDLADREEAARLNDEAQKAADAQNAGSENGVSEEEQEKLDKAANAAEEAYADHPLTVEQDDSGLTVRCKLSGVPILEGDDQHTDNMGDDGVLSILLVDPDAADDTAGDSLSEATQGAQA